ncbi:C40 family peptidase [Nitratidesulfovibrio sp. 1201_IL3209]|uniref:C40 family peptidase n=1 Tax=Nitratidesulfovibrio sp. 1201_IL3209 TaxID=3084053 RepID=UPI002FD9C443
MPHWSDRYVGIPFREGGRDFSGCDCAGLVLLVLREEHGIVAADTDAAYGPDDFHGAPGQGRLAELVERGLREWRVVSGAPRPFDLVRYAVGGNPCHVGLCVGGGMILHALEGAARSHLIALASPQWRRRFVEFRRHERLMEAPA